MVALQPQRLCLQRRHERTDLGHGVFVALCGYLFDGREAFTLDQKYWIV